MSQAGVINGNGSSPGNTLVGEDGISVTTGGGTSTITPRGAGVGNMFLGENTGNLTLSGSNNLGYGKGALLNIATSNDMIAIGIDALAAATGGGNTVAIGNGALASCLAPVQTVAIGFNSMNLSTATDSCVCIGSYSGRYITTFNNVAIGYGSMSGPVNGGGQCVGIGTNALAANDTGIQCVGVGYLSLVNLTSGSYNVALGPNSGSSYTSSESSNITILNNGITGESHTVRIGNQGSGAASQDRCFIAGITGATVTGDPVLCDSNGQLGTISSSIRYKHSVKELYEDTSIMHLRPVSFVYKSTSTKSYGLIAEDVDLKFPDLCRYNDQGLPESVKYHEMPALLLHEIQKLNDRIMLLEARG